MSDRPQFAPSQDIVNLQKQFERAQVAALEEKNAPPKITEPRCHTCTHPNRDWIEFQIVRGHSYLSIQESLRGLEDESLHIDRRSISGHVNKGHMRINEAAYRAILEQESALDAQNYETGVKGAITARGILEIAMRKGFDDIINDISSVEPKDLIQIVKLKMDMDEKHAAIQVEEYKNQVATLTEAIQNVIPPALQGELVDEIKRLRKRKDIDSAYEEIVGHPTIEAQSVVDTSSDT